MTHACCASEEGVTDAIRMGMWHVWKEANKILHNNTMQKTPTDTGIIYPAGLASSEVISCCLVTPYLKSTPLNFIHVLDIHTRLPLGLTLIKYGKSQLCKECRHYSLANGTIYQEFHIARVLQLPKFSSQFFSISTILYHKSRLSPGFISSLMYCN